MKLVPTSVKVCRKDDNVLPGFITEDLFPLSLLCLLEEVVKRVLGGSRSALITRGAFERIIRVNARSWYAPNVSLDVCVCGNPAKEGE